jgi:hypothetical protein
MRKKSAPTKRVVRPEEQEEEDLLVPLVTHLDYGAPIATFRDYFLNLLVNSVDAPLQPQQEILQILGRARGNYPVAKQYSLSYQQVIDINFEWTVCRAADIQANRPILMRLIDWFARHSTTMSLTTVRESQIPNAGYGLFALRHIRAGDIITRYGGLRMSHDWFRFSTAGVAPSDYIIRLHNHEIIDGSLCFRLCDMGQWANDATHSSSQFTNNAETVESENVHLRATRDIQIGEEIFWDYGKFYGQMQMCIQCGIKPAKIIEVENPSNMFCDKNTCQKKFHSHY